MSRRRTWLAAVGLVFGLLLAACTPVASVGGGTVGGGAAKASTGWTLAYRDEFTGTQLGPGWGKYSGPIVSTPGGVWDRSHVQVGGGLATLTTAKVNGVWTSGGIMNTVGGKQKYGKYEIRMRVDKAMGVKWVALLWPASGAWPGDGEIDFAEDGGGHRKGAAGTVIYSLDRKAVWKQQHKVTADFSQWHTVGVEWTKGRVDFTLDGAAWGSVRMAHVPSTPMNLAIQTEAGSCGKWMTCTDASTPATTRLQIGWVAVYRR